MMNNKPVSIYVHIPFCIKKCSYCDFLSMPADDTVKEEYLQALREDIEKTVTLLLEKEYEVDTIFVGGGTPSSLSEKQLEKLCESIDYILQKTGAKSETPEISMECNPGTLNIEKIKILKKYGINRISLGLQSANDNELKLLGRIHSYKEFVDNYMLLRENGFSNINIDLMSALPLQTVESYTNTLRTVVALEPEHISAYSLIIEEGTKFYDKYAKDDMLRAKGEKPAFLPDEEMERRMYELTEEILSDNGYKRYEISNYSKEGFECRHNTGYWTGKNYIGIGLGAASLFENQRFTKTRKVADYLKKDFKRYEMEALSVSDRMEEFMFLGLRLIKGVSKQEFFERFSTSIEEIYEEQLNRLQKEGLLINEEKSVRLSKKGIDVSNYVFSQFLF